MPLVHAHNLEGFLLGTVQPLVQFLEVPNPNRGQYVIRTLNPEYIVWNRKYQYLVSWLLSSMSESMLGHATRYVRAAEIWYTLE